MRSPCCATGQSSAYPGRIASDCTPGWARAPMSATACPDDYWGFCPNTGGAVILKENDCSTSCRTLVGPIFAGEKRMYGSASRTDCSNAECVDLMISSDAASANPVVSTT